MNSLGETYSAVLAAAAVLGALLAVIALGRIRAPGATGLALTAFGTSIWCGAYAIEWLVPTLASKLLVDNFVTLGSAIVPTGGLIFAIQVCGRGRWLSRPVLALLAVPALIQVTLAWTNPLHHLYYAAVDLTTDSGLTYLTFVDGPAYVALRDDYVYALFLVAVVLLVQGFRGARGFYRIQFALILAGDGVVLVASVLSQTGLSPWQQLDLAPVSLALANPIMAYALLQLRLLDIVPVARGALVESMEDCVVVLDNRDRVVDMNPAAHRLLGLVGVPTIGLSAEVAFGAFSVDFAQLDPNKPIRAEVQTGGADWVDVRVLPLRDQPGRITGRLIVVHDIQRLKQAEIGLLQANERLRQQLSEIETLHAQVREQAIRDPLTGLVNRRFLEESLPRDLARSERVGESISLVMVDIDNFKLINDQFGHQAGDAVLVGVATLLNTKVRPGDIVSRHGGEEFLLVLPGADSEAAWRRAEELRQTIEATTFPIAGRALSVTISAGISSYPSHAPTVVTLIKAADDALYLAKMCGRNRVCLGE